MIEKLIAKWEPHKIKGLMKYIVILYAAGFLSNLINPMFYYEYLMLDIDMVLEGQVWRLFTFIIQPIDGTNIFFELLMLFVYYSIGNSIENMRGSARFNLFYFNGLILNILSTIIIYLMAYFIFGIGLSYPVSLSYFNTSMFIALAMLIPDMTFLFMFFIPMKAKYLIIINILFFGYDIYLGFSYSWFQGVCTLIMIAMAMFNMLLFYGPRKNVSSAQRRRKAEFMRSYNAGMREGAQAGGTGAVITRHKCAVCGRTEKDGINLEFRFCSKCNGNYEYCQDHLFTHIHIQ